MSQLDVKHTLKDTIVQPQFVRHHHAYRSAMSSEIINLEISQFRFDLAKIYKKSSDIISDLEQKMNTLYFNTSTLEAYSFYRASDESSGSFILNSLDSVTSKLEVLKNRLDKLEKGSLSA